MNNALPRFPTLSARRASLLAGVFIVAYLAAALGLETNLPISAGLRGGIMAAAALAAGAWLLAAARSQASDDGRAAPARMFWLLLALAHLFAAGAEVLWASSAAWTGAAALALLAAGLYLAFTLLLVFALLLESASANSRPERFKLLLDMSILVLAASLILWTFWPPMEAEAGRLLIRGRPAHPLAYPVGDVAVFVALVLLLLRRGLANPPLLLLAGGVLVNVATNLLIGGPIGTTSSAPAGWINIGWLLAYSLVGVAGALHASGPVSMGADRAAKPVDSASPQVRWRRVLIYLPYVLVAAAYVVMFWGRQTLSAARLSLLGVAVGGMAALLVARQVLILAESRSQLRAEQRRRQSDAVLLELSRRLLSAQDEAGACQCAADLAASALGVDRALLALSDERDRLWVRACFGWPNQAAEGLNFVADETSHLGRTVAAAQPLAVADYETQAAPPFHAQGTPDGVRSGLSAPLLIEGRLGGALLVTSSVPRLFGDEDIRLLSLIASQTAAGLERLRLFAVKRRHVDELTVLHAAASAANEAVNEDELIAWLTSIVGDGLSSHDLGVMLVDVEAGVLRAHVSYRGVDNQFVTPLGQGITGHVALTGRPARVADVRSDPRYIAVEGRTRSELCVPLMAGDRALGVFNIESQRLNAFSEADEQLILTIASQAATGIEKLRLFHRLFQAEQQRAAELEAVRQASLGLTASLDPEMVFEAILQSTLRLAPDADKAFVFLYSGGSGQDGHLTLGASRQFDGRRSVDWQPRPQGFTYAVARQGEVVVVSDMRRHPLFADSPDDWGGAIVGLPLKIGGRVVGVMSVAYPQPRQFPDSELRVLRLLGDQAAIAIENARLFDAERAARVQAEALREVSATLTFSLDRRQLLNLLLGQLARVVPYDSASVMLFVNDQLTLAAHSGFQDPAQTAVTHAGSDLGHIKEVIDTSRPVIIADTRSDPRWRSVPGGEYIRCWLGVPLVGRGGAIGLLNLDKREPGYYTPQDAALTAVFANHAAVAIENARLFEAESRQLSLSQTLQAVGALLTAQMSLQDVFENIFDLLAQVIAFDSVTIQLAALDGTLRLAAGRGLHDMEAAAAAVSHISERRMTTLWLERRVAVVPDTALDPDWEALPGDNYIRSWIGAALVVKGELVGLLTTDSATPNAYDDAMGETVLAFANQAAVAIENARLFEESQRQTRALAGLYNTALATGSVLEPDVLLWRLYEQVRPLLTPDAFLVALYDPAPEELEVALAIEGGRLAHDLVPNGRTPVSQGLSGWVVRTRQSLLVDDLQIDALPVPPRHGVRPARSWLGVPLIAHDRVIGAASVQSFSPGAFSTSDQRFLESVASQVAIAIENARLYAETSARADELSRLYAAAQDLGARLEPKVVLRQLARHLTEAVDATSGYVSEMNRARDGLLVLAEYWSAGAAPEERASDLGSLVSLADHPGIRLAIEQQAVVELQVDDPEIDDGERRELQRYGVKSSLILPIVARGLVLGQAEVWESRRRRSFTFAERRLLQTLCQHAAGVIENARLFDETRRRDAILEALAYAGGQLLLASHPDEVMPDVLGQLGQAAGVSRAYIFANHLSEDGQQLASLRHEWVAPGQPPQAASPDWQALPYDAAGFGRWRQTLSDGRPLDGLVREFPVSERERLRRLCVLSLAIVPIFSGGQWWGFLGFDDCEQERIWSGAEIEALKSAAGALGAFVARQTIEAAEREQRALAEALRDTAVVLNSTLDLDEVLDRILTDVGHVVPHDSANIMLMEAGIARVVRARDQLNRFPEQDLLAVRFRVEEASNLRYMLDSGQPAIIVNVAQYPGWVALQQTAWIRSTVGAPIRIKGTVIGFITLDSSRIGFFTHAHAERLQAFAHQAGLAIENAQLYASIRQHADELEQRVDERTRELADANVRLKELDQLKDQFISNVSHELRTPLTNIKLHLGLLDKRGPEALERYLPTLQRETERLRRLIEELLDLARLQTQQVPLPRQPHPLDDLLAEVIALHAARAEAKGLVLRHETNPARLVVPVDRSQMLQVFTNLIGNALAYTPAAGVVRVSSRLARMGTTTGANILFFNDGPPIPPQDLPHLFRRFYRGQTAQDSGEPGTGLGLAICREIVERHGGRIEAASAPGQGTVFTVWLPLA